MTTDQTWLRMLPSHLQQRAYMSGEEAAWNRTDAVSVLEWAQRNQFEVLGIEVWLPTTPGPTVPGLYIWDSPRGQEFSFEQICQAAKEFIETFDWHQNYKEFHGLEPYFNLTLEENPRAED